MAVCYSCNYKHYDNVECPNCGKPVEYTCWECGEFIDPSIETKCRKCGWFICPECGKCGCDENRPKSREENGEGWNEEDY